MPRRIKMADTERPEIEVATQPETEIQPPDGGWGWVVCFAVFFTNFTTVGMTAISGVLLLELLKLFNEPLSKTTIVFSFFSGATMFGGPLVSIPLMFKASHRQIMMVGGIIAAASAVASYFAPNIETLMFTFGILLGLSLAVNYFAGNVTLGHYFLKKRALALGIANSGIGFGSFTLNYLSTEVIPFYGMRGTFLLFGGLFLNLTVYGALCRPLKLVNKQSPDISQNGRNSIDQTEGTENLGFEAEAGHREKRDEKYDYSSRRISEDVEPVPKMLRVRQSITSEMVPDDFYIRKTGYCDATMYKNKYFYLLLAVYIFNAVTCSVEIYLPVYAVSIGLSQEEGALIVAIYGITGIGSQILVGFLVDIIHIPASYLLLVASTFVSLGTILIPFCQSFETLALSSVTTSTGYNFGISLRIVMIAGMLGMENMSTAYSILTTLIGTMYIIYPIVNGVVYEATQHFSAVFYVDSAIAFMGAVLSCAIVYAQKTGKFVE